MRNDIDLDALWAFEEQARAEPKQASALTRARAVWERGSAPAFTGITRLSSGAKYVMEADLPGAFTGTERTPSRPAPVQHELFGVATCYATCLLSVAAQCGLELEEIRVTVETEANFSRLLVDPNGPPPVGPVHVRVEVKPGTPEALATVREISEVAKARAPGVYMVAHPVPVTVEVTGVS
jgi:uncharacterized OsmC-like protein